MITLLLAAALSWHPNQGASLPAPVIPDLTNLSAPKLALESPQSLIFYDGGVIGYFPAQPWLAPIWTTPAASWVDTPEDAVERWRDHHPPPCEVPEPGLLSLVGAALMLCYRRR